jgi:hypothetical protein
MTNYEQTFGSIRRIEVVQPEEGSGETDRG